MNSIVECVPNFSDGRRPEVIDAIAKAIESVPDAYVLDREMDKDHNRSVITFVGTLESVGEAAVRAIAKAAELIDLTHHQGEHPRIGASDVVPFIPVQNATMEDCVEIAKQVGRQVWERCRIPVYLYEYAATRPERRNLADIRKGQFEGLREEVRINPARRPDFGEAELHPTAGATVIGARRLLVAYNINLDTPDVGIATRIAHAIRHISGGLRYVKALGFKLEERNIAQVSMNLTDFEATPVHRVFNMVESEAQRWGAHAVSSQIIGLIPKKAIEMSAEHFLRIENFSPDLVLENKLAKVLEGRASSSLAEDCGKFLARVASKDPVPGGGSVSALSIALGASLGVMAIGLSRGRKKFLVHDAKLGESENRLNELSRLAKAAVDEDAQAYSGVMSAYKMPKDTDEGWAARDAEIEKTTIHASRVPLNAAETGIEVLEILASLVGITNVNCASDLKVGRYVGEAGVRGALDNVRINLSGIKDEKIIEALKNRVEGLAERLTSMESGR